MFYTNVQRIGNKLWLRHYDESGRDCVSWINDFAPTLYVKTNEETKHKTIFDQYLKPIKTDGLKHARDMIKEYEGISGFELFGNTNWEYSFLFEKYGNRLQYDFDKIKIDYVDIETSVGENSKGFPKPFYAAERVTLLTVRRAGHYHVFSYKDFDVSKLNDIGLPIHKHMFVDEDSMFRGYIAFHSSDYPHAMTSWNGDGFDTPYLINRIRQRLGNEWVNRLSPLGQVTLEFAEDDESIVKKVYLRGIELLDYLAMYKKFIPGERDFKLDSVAEDHLEENKVDNPFTSFVDFYTGAGDVTNEEDAAKGEVQSLAFQRWKLKQKIKELGLEIPEDNTKRYSESILNEFCEIDIECRQKSWDLFVWYNIRDVDLVYRLEGELGLLNLCFTIAYLVGMNYSDVFGTVKPWDIFLQNEMNKKGKFVSVRQSRGSMPRPLMGGFVHLYKAGLYKDGITLDATSLYPSIIMTFNIGPETKVQEHDLPPELLKYYDKLHIQDYLENGIDEALTLLLQHHKLCMTMNGQFYRTDKQGIIAETVSEVFKDRKAEKRKMLDYEGELEAVENEIKELEALLEAA